MKAQPRSYTDTTVFVIEKDIYYTLPIEGWPDYHASTCGSIISTKNKKPATLTPRDNNNGYLQVCLSKDNQPKYFYVHRLIAQTFYEPPSNDRNDRERTDVNHIDSNKTNNKTANLEWCSPSENKTHAWMMNRLNKELEATANV